MQSIKISALKAKALVTFENKSSLILLIFNSNKYYSLNITFYLCKYSLLPESKGLRNQNVDIKFHLTPYQWSIFQKDASINK